MGDKVIGRKKKTPQRAKKTETAKSDFFVSICKTSLGVECVREYKFHPVRKWRFDYAIPQYKIAIEIDGGVWNYGRHNRAAGYMADMEKFNAAAQMGWLVLKFTPQQQYTTATFQMIRRTVETVIKDRKETRTV